jgi:hypothetical protein
MHITLVELPILVHHIRFISLSFEIARVHIPENTELDRKSQQCIVYQIGIHIVRRINLSFGLSSTYALEER